jgi:choice-of-anchor B domain-containing protein
MKLVCLATLAGMLATATAAHAQTRAGGTTDAVQAGFGSAVIFVGDELLVGEPNNTVRPGLVYVYRRGANGWEESGQLRVPGGGPGDGFGQVLAVDGMTLFAGVPTHEGGRGVVHVFQRAGTGWAHASSIESPDTAARGRFGGSIVIRGEHALIGAPGENQGAGAVYAFRRTTDGWTRQARLAAADAARGMLFGNSIAVLDDVAFIGMPGLNENRGHVGVFARSATGEWTQTATLTTPDLQPNDRFGWALAASGSTLIATAPLNGGAIGAAFIFAKNAAGEWTEQHRLAPESATAPTVFGVALSFDGTTLLAGAPVVGGQRGAVYHATRSSDGSWSTVTAFAVAALPANGQFGGAVTVHGDLAAATVSNDDFGAGTVIVFERSGSDWQQRSALRSAPETLASIRGNQVRCSDDGTAAAFGCHDVELLSFLAIPDMGGARGVRLNDIWGWTDPESGREYALVGRVNGMSVVDVSDPVNPVFVADLPLTEGANPATWRDIKVYRDHAFIVADGSGAHGMQVLDLTRVRAFDGTPLDLTPDTTYGRINSAHNIVINEESGFAYAVGASQGGETCGGGLHMIDIREPKNPTFAGCFSDPQTGRASTGYSHDAQCVTYRGPDTRYHDREICFGSNETALSVADVTDKDDPKPLSRASYPNVAYSHQAWLDEEQRYLYMNDELDELNGIVPRTRTLIWDLADLEDPQLVREHLGVEPASDHNLYIRGDLMYQSNYKSGLRILDISDRANPREVAFFKTFPGDDAAAGFSGSWSNYPYFSSGIIIVSSIGEGLFILKKRDTNTVF